MAGSADALTGRIVYKGDPLYELQRAGATWNARKPNRYPSAIVLAESDKDVIAAVKLAKQRGWQVTARSGGHSFSGSHNRDNALMVNISKMKELTVDAKSRTAVASPAWLGDQLNKILEILAAGRDVFLNLPSPEATMLWMQWGPVQKLPDMAYSLQGDTYLSPSILYRDATDDERIAGWVSGAIAKLRPISIGSQMNDENMPQNKGPYLSKEASTRLDAMRKKYDPEKRFPGFLS